MKTQGKSDGRKFPSSVSLFARHLLPREKAFIVVRSCQQYFASAATHRTEGFSLGRSSAAGGDEGVIGRKRKRHYYWQCVPLIRLAVRSTPSPAWKKAFIVVRFSCWLPFYSTIANRYEQPMHPSMPPWHADRRSAQGGRQVARATPSFIQSSFTSQRSLLWYFLGLQESTVPSYHRSPFPIRKWGRRQVPRPQSNQSRNSSRSVTPNSLAMARRSSSVMVCSTGLPLASTSM